MPEGRPKPPTSVVKSLSCSSASLIRTLKLHACELLDVSVAVQVAVVVPMGKVEPEDGEHDVLATPQLSATVGEKLTTAPAGDVAGSVTSAGQVSVGAVVSFTVTFVVHMADAPVSSVTVSVTDVVPSGYGPVGD